MRERVLHLTSELPPIAHFGGLGTAVGGLTAASARAQLHVAVLLVLDEGGIGYGGYGRARVAPPSSRHVRTSLHAAGVTLVALTGTAALRTGICLAKVWGAQVVHLHSPWLWPLARGIREAAGTPVVYTVHSLDRAAMELGKEQSEWLAHGSVQEDAILGADRVVVLSVTERDLLLSYYPDVRPRVATVGNGVARFPPFERGQGAERRSDCPLVLYAGRLVERKGVGDFLNVVPDVLKTAPRTRFVVAGGDPQASPTELARSWLPPQLEGSRRSIHFTGWLDPRRLAQWYRTADVLVVPSRYEPFGMVVLEGMLHGLTVVASDVGGPGEIIDAGDTGLLFPPKDTSSLAEALGRVVTDPPLRLRLGAAAASEARRRWGWDRIVQQMRAVYGEAMGA